jgi:hypothetical protein
VVIFGLFADALLPTKHYARPGRLVSLIIDDVSTAQVECRCLPTPVAATHCAKFQTPGTKVMPLPNCQLRHTRLSAHPRSQITT